jgi:hypothetical protein
MKKLILISLYEKGVLKDIKKRYPRTGEGAIEIFSKTIDETAGEAIKVSPTRYDITNGTTMTKVEIVNRF